MRFFPSLFLFLAAADFTFAASYYVAPGGLDANPGTLAQPWLTIQKAANTLAPGDTAYVRAGTYAKVTVNVSGSAPDKYVTFRNYPNETPVIDATGVTPPAGDTALFLLVNRSYVVIQGFELRNYKTANAALVPTAIFLTGACQHVQIRNCNIHDIWNTGGNTATSGNAFGIAVYGTSATSATDIIIDGNDVHDLKTGSSESVAINGNVTNFQVTNNTVHDNNNIGIVFIGYEGTCPDAAQDKARNGVCRGNTVWNITSQGNQAYVKGDYSADGLYCDGAASVILERNVVHDTDIGVELASEHTGKNTIDIIVRDNFVYANRQTGLFLGGYANSGTGGTAGCTIIGNTFYKNDTLNWGNGEAQLRFRTVSSVLRDNVFYAGAGNTFVTVPVSAANNSNNKFDDNLYYSASGAAASLWRWNNGPLTGFTAWKNASAQDAHSLFADPKFVSTSATPDLHLRLDSPAVDSGDPAFAIGNGETDLDGGLRITGTRVDIGADELAPIDSWRLARFGTNALNPAVSGALADPEYDGLVNLIEYPLGLDPLTESNASLPRVQTVSIANTPYLALRFTHLLAASDVICTVQIASALGAWSDGSHYGGVSADLPTNGFTTEVSRDMSRGMETIVVRDNLPFASNSRRFMRLHIMQ